MEKPLFDKEKNPRQAAVAEILAEARELATWYNVELETVLNAYDITLRDHFLKLLLEKTEDLILKIEVTPTTA